MFPFWKLHNFIRSNSNICTVTVLITFKGNLLQYIIHISYEYFMNTTFPTWPSNSGMPITSSFQYHHDPLPSFVYEECKGYFSHNSYATRYRLVFLKVSILLDANMSLMTSIPVNANVAYLQKNALLPCIAQIRAAWFWLYVFFSKQIFQ